ncbi:MAG TPA: FAD-binding oxidoreductase [Candidatus Xenobia bacterium]|jgi:sarcosine oxidase subunit beta
MQKTADVVVIGAGVMGSSIAFHLAQRGVGRVLVLEKGRVCGGNTRKSGALVRMHYTYAPEVRLALAALPVFQNFSEIVGGPCGFTETGFLMIVGPTQVEKLHRNVEMLRGCGVDTSSVRPDEIRELQPCAEVGGIGGAAFEPHSGYADPVATTLSFMAAARQRGVMVEEGVKVERVLTEAGEVCGVQTSAGTVATRSVVCAAGPWSKYLHDLPIDPVRAQIAFFQRSEAYAQEPSLERQMVYIDTLTGMYSRPHSDGQSLLGIGAWGDTAVANPDAYDESNDLDYIPEVRRRTAMRLPALGGVSYVRGHAGLYDVTPDSRCLLDKDVGAKGFFLAAGFSGTGFKLSPTIGRVMSELVVDGKAAFVDIHPFRQSRFSEGQECGDPAAEYDLPPDFGHRF